MSSAITPTSVSSAASAKHSETPTSTASAEDPTPTVAFASDDPNGIAWVEGSDSDPEPIRGSLGASVLGPQNVPIDQQNADMLAPPTTDNGDV